MRAIFIWNPGMRFVFTLATIRAIYAKHLFSIVYVNARFQHFQLPILSARARSTDAVLPLLRKYLLWLQCMWFMWRCSLSNWMKCIKMPVFIYFFRGFCLRLRSWRFIHFGSTLPLPFVIFTFIYLFFLQWNVAWLEHCLENSESMEHDLANDNDINDIIFFFYEKTTSEKNVVFNAFGCSVVCVSSVLTGRCA